MVCLSGDLLVTHVSLQSQNVLLTDYNFNVNFENVVEALMNRFRH